MELETGITMRYVDAGNAGGEVVLLLHGFTDTSRSYAPVMEHLVEMRPDLRLIALEQRGHGASSLPSGPECRRAPETCVRVEDFASDVLAFLDAKNIVRAHVVGHSLGSMIAEEVALRRPDRVRRLVLMGSAARTKDHPALQGFFLDGLIEGPWKQALETKATPSPRGRTS